MDSLNSEERIALDGGPSGWLKIAQRGNLNPGGVLLFFGGFSPLDRFVAGWDLTMKGLAGINGERLFEHVCHIIPPNIGKRDVATQIRVEFQKLGENPSIFELPNIEQALAAITTIQTSSLEADEVIAVLESLPERSAIGLSCSTLFRFREVHQHHGISVSTWTGNYNQTDHKNTFRPDLFRLTKHALELAKSKNDLIVLFCEEIQLHIDDLPTDLQVDPDLAVHSLLVSAEMYETSQVQNSILGSFSQSESIPEIQRQIGLIANLVQRALLKSELFFAKEEFHSAWLEISPFFAQILLEGRTGNLLEACQVAIAAGHKEEACQLLERISSCFTVCDSRNGRTKPWHLSS